MINKTIKDADKVVKIAEEIKTGDVLATIFSIVFLVAFLWLFFELIKMLKGNRKKEEKNQEILQNIVNTNERSLDTIKKQNEIINRFSYEMREMKNDNREIKNNVHDLSYEFSKVLDGFNNLKFSVETLKTHCGVVLEIKEEVNDNKKRNK